MSVIELRFTTYFELSVIAGHLSIISLWSGLVR
jgi:hypothetical protein